MTFAVSCLLFADVTGVRKLIFEVVKTSSSVRITGVTALLWHVMRGTYSRLHSRAEKVLQFLMDKSIISLRNEYPQGKLF